MTEHIDALAMQADSLDAETAAASPQAMIAQQEETQGNELASSNTRELMMIGELASPLIEKILPNVHGAISPGSGAMLASAWGTVFAKYGKDLAAFGGKHKEEIAAGIMTLSVVTAIWDALMLDIKNIKQGKKPEQIAALPAEPKAAAKEPDSVRLG